MATLDRRALLAAAPAMLVAACEPKLPVTVSTTPKIDLPGLERAIGALAAEAAPAALGVGLINLESGEAFLFKGERRFPMMSIFKLPLGAAVLSEVDAGRLSLDEPFILTDSDLSPSNSPISAGWPARRDYLARELLEAAMVGSDNTAADVLMKRIGGPGALTAWLDSRHLTGLRIDRYERELQPESFGMASFRPDWRDPAVYSAVRARIPAATRMAAMRAYLADPRDTATPRGMVEFLQKLDRRELVSAGSTDRILDYMRRNPGGVNRFRAGFPSDSVFAHRTGASGVDQGLSLAHNDAGILTLADRRRYAIAGFLSGSTADEAQRDSIFARVARAAVVAIG